MLSIKCQHLTAVCGIFLALGLGCGQRGQNAKRPSNKTVRVEGSDTMVNLAQAWAEQHRKTHPDVSVQVLGGGTGVGIASLIDGNCDMANTSRKMKESEIKRAKQNRGADPKEIIVGFDALAIYVHKDNPLDGISIDQLAEIYGDGGKITKWSDLGVKDPKWADQNITRVSRQSSSGTYTYFREVVLGTNRDYKLGSIDQSGSKDVVALVSHTPSAIGYSGMGYHTPDVKMLKVAKKTGAPAIMPSVETAKNDSYPITRPLQIYIIGEPTGTLKEYLDWILSPEGQKVVQDLGYVPVKLHE